MLFFAATTKPKATVEITTDSDHQSGDMDEGFFDYTDPNYTIVSMRDTPINLVIDAKPGYRNTAIDQIYDFDLSPTDYRIIFIHGNPFAPKQEGTIRYHE